MPTDQVNSKGQARWLAAIAEPTHLTILRQLAAGEMTVTALAQACGTEVVNVSHHLQAMKSAGLLSAERDGRFVRYTLVGATAAATLLTLTHESGITVTIPLG